MQLRTGRSAPPAISIAAFYVVSLIGAGIGESTAIQPNTSPMFWLPVGILLAVLLDTPRREWPWWLAGAAAAELTGNLLWWHNPWLPSLGYALANAIEAMAAAAAIRAIAGPPSVLLKPAHTAVFIVIGGVVAPAISATIIAAIDLGVGKAPFAETWRSVWLGDASGILVAAPLTLAAIDLWRERGNADPRKVAEIAAVGLLLVGIEVAVLAGYLPTLYLTLPPLLWAAMRFQMRGAFPALGLLVLVAAITSFERGGPFGATMPVDRQIVYLEIFFSIAAVSSLFVAVLACQHDEARKALKQANAALEARVSERTARLAAALRAGRLGVIELDLANSIATMDATVRDLLEVEHPRITIPALLERIAPADRGEVVARIEAAIRSEAGGRVEIECRLGEGRAGESRTRWIVVDLEPLDGRTPCQLVGIVRDVSESREAQRRQQLLVDELSHRVKNTLSMVQAIAVQTLAGRTSREARDAFLARIAAFARGHDMLAGQNWEAAALDELVRQAVMPFGLERFDLDGRGARVFLPAAQALPIALALHELCANAAKYGALCVPDGRVGITWEPFDGLRRFRLTWQESGGPPVRPRKERGFGSVLLERVLAEDLRGQVELRFDPGGVNCTVDAPLSPPDPAEPDERQGG